MADPLGVSIAFTAASNVVEPSWTRIDALPGCRVREWSIDRGRPNEFAKTDTGTARVRIVDRAGLFDPTNPSSPYAGNIMPGKQAAIALRNPIGDAWHTLFRGFVETWRYELGRTRDHFELELSLVDAFAIFSRFELRVGIDGAIPPFTGLDPDHAAKLAEFAQGNVLYGETEGPVQDRILAVLGDMGWPALLTEVYTGNVRVGPKAYGPGTPGLDALWDAADAEFPGVANMYMSKKGWLIFHGRQARFRPDVAEYQIAKRTVGDPSATELDADVVPVSELEWSLGWDNVFNSASATPQGIGSGLDWRPLDPEVDDIDGQYVVAPGVLPTDVRSITFDNLQTLIGIATGNDSLTETRLMAQYYVENYAEPIPRISRMVFKSRRPGALNGAALWQHLCNCEISDLLTLKTEHPGGGGFDDQYYVEGIHYTGRPGSGEVPMIELALDVSPRAHWISNPFDADTDPPGP